MNLVKNPPNKTWQGTIKPPDTRNAPRQDGVMTVVDYQNKQKNPHQQSILIVGEKDTRQFLQLARIVVNL